MSDMDFSDLGREIEEKIKQFANSQEMKDLQENIRVTVEKTMSEVRRSAKDAADYVNKNVDIRWEHAQNGKSGESENKTVNSGKQSNTGRQNQGQAYGGQSKDAGAYKSGSYNTAQKGYINTYKKRQLPVVRSPKGRVSGVLMTVLGTCGAVVGWTAALTGLVMIPLGGNIFGGIVQSLFSGFLGGALSAGVASMELAGMLSTGFIAVLAAICTAIAAAGGVLRRRAKRFRTYVKAIGAKDFYSIEGFAQSVGKKEKYVIKDLKKMIHRRWFREGHLDEQETCFMLTDEAYQMYLDAQAELERRKQEEERHKQEQEMLEQDPVRKQLKITIEEGKEYIRRIRSVNDDIPGEDISGKLYRLERVCTRIFEHIEDNPEKLSDIRKFMNYYLPTTLKLVETYHEFSIQPVQGENITMARKEIEEMLDSINGAFEKMFDKLFEDDAMDISTDISVLSTMLAQEGLLQDEFKV